MVNLESKISQSLGFLGRAEPLVGDGAEVAIVIESGVALVTFSGANEGDWTRDTLSFPVARPAPRSQFIRAIASAGLGSFGTVAPRLQTDLRIVPGPPEMIPIGPLHVISDGGILGMTDGVTITIPSSSASLAGSIPAIGCAVDDAHVDYSDEASQPVIFIDVAVFGSSSIILRITYTTHIMYKRSTESPVVRP